MDPKPMLTKTDVANRLNMTVRGVEGLMAKRSLPFYRLGNRTVRFDPTELEDWLNRMKVAEVHFNIHS